MIPIANPKFEGNEEKYLLDVIRSGFISSQGKYVKEFERQFAEKFQVEHALACSSGTTALHLALLALNIKNGDEVIVPTFTYIASVNASTYCNAKPIFVDSDDTWNIDPDKIEEKITSKTKAIIAVHLYGMPCNMQKIMDIAQKHGLKVIEDSAECLGGKVLVDGEWKYTGSIGDVGTFSLFPNKVLTSGEGGIVTTNSDEIAKKIKLYREQGVDTSVHRYFHKVVGYNYRTTNLQMAVALAQLEQFDKFNNERQIIKETYNSFLTNVSDITLMPSREWAKPVCWLYSILVPERDKLVDLLKDNQVDTRPFFIPAHHLPPYKYNKKYPIAEYLFETGINLPTFCGLSKDEIKLICNVIKSMQVE